MIRRFGDSNIISDRAYQAEKFQKTKLRSDGSVVLAKGDMNLPQLRVDGWSCGSV